MHDQVFFRTVFFTAETFCNITAHQPLAETFTELNFAILGHKYQAKRIQILAALCTEKSMHWKYQRNTTTEAQVRWASFCLEQ